MVENVVEVVELLAPPVSAREGPGLVVGAVEVVGEPAEECGHGEVGFAVAKVDGGVEEDRYQFNEDTLWSGHPHDYSHKGAAKHLGTIRQLLFDGKQKEAQDLAGKEFMSVPLRQEAYMAFGDLTVKVANTGEATNYRRALDLASATTTVTPAISTASKRSESMRSTGTGAKAI